MKIGILTMHNGSNYGGTLQCYALYRILNSFGHNVEVINFVPQQKASFIKRFIFNLTSCRTVLDCVLMLSRLTKKQGLKRHSPNIDLVHIFDVFRNLNMKYSPIVNELTIAELNHRYDCIVVGSDQVWGSYVRSKLVFFGDWAPHFPGLLISYAACATSEKYPLIRKNKLKNLLRKFNCISVRDQKSFEVVKKILHKDVPIALDPTLLYDFPDFHGPSLVKGDYVLIYVLGEEIHGSNSLAIKYIRNFYQNNLKVIAITIYGETIPYADETFTDVSPENWVKLIANAKLVYTDSFHGVIFSLKNKVPFIAYYKEKNRASRLLDLSQRFAIHKNFISNAEDISKSTLNDFIINDNTIRLIDVQKKLSRDYLKSNFTL